MDLLADAEGYSIVGGGGLPSGQGIDRVYSRVQNGVNPVVISEAKYGQGRLRMTQTRLQMSREWMLYPWRQLLAPIRRRKYALRTTRMGRQREH
jgi:hypothetical protein